MAAAVTWSGVARLLAALLLLSGALLALSYCVEKADAIDLTVRQRADLARLRDALAALANPSGAPAVAGSVRLDSVLRAAAGAASLAQDPDPGLHHLAAIATVRLPLLLQSAAALRDVAGAAQPSERRRQLALLADRRAALADDLGRAMAHDPGLRATIRPDAAVSALDALVVPPSEDGDAAASGTLAIAALAALSTRVLDILDGLLAARLGRIGPAARQSATRDTSSAKG